MDREARHVPVLLREVMETLRPQKGQFVVDCTVGLGGHCVELLRAVGPQGRLIGFDFDQQNLMLAQQKLSAIGTNYSLHQTNFAALPNVLASLGIERVDAILADLGIASPQIDDPARGFSYRQPGPLDMRMDRSRGQPAAALVNRLSEKELATTIRELGDEEDAEAIASLIVQHREMHPIETTQDLTQIVCEARHFTLQRAAGAKLHPAARTFQALRMMVNREIANLERLLDVLPDCLNGGGRAALISFHSGEDRLVKRALRDGLEAGVYSQVSRDPVIAGDAEQKANPRSRSAKLRWAERSELKSET